MSYKYYYTNPPLLPQEVLMEIGHTLSPRDFQGNFFVIAKNDNWRHVLETYEAYAAFKERDMANYAKATPEEEVKDHINPAHYKQHMVIRDKDGNETDVLQWIEHQQYMPYWRNNMRAFVQAILIQSDKYLSRLGQKDDETQEMLKALWYMKFATAVMKNGLRPVRVSEIETILNRKD